MSKALTLVFAVLALTYVFFLGQLKNPESRGWVNRELRPCFLKSKIIRAMFFLDNPGDARYVYFSPKKQEVLVEVDYQKGMFPDENIEIWLTSLIDQTSDKEARVKIGEEAAIGEAETFTDQELIRIEETSRDFDPENGEAYLHIIYISRSAEAGTNTGLTLKDQSLFIFREGIDRLTDKPRVRSRIEESTLKHEFGHLLGLEHSEAADCVMNERVEVYENREYQFENVPLEYGEESLEKLRMMRLE